MDDVADLSRVAALGGLQPSLARLKACSCAGETGVVPCQAHTWDKVRRVVARLQHGEHGANPRFIVTDLPGSPKALYECKYCARGEAENRIKDAQLDLFGRRR